MSTPILGNSPRWLLRLGGERRGEEGTRHSREKRSSVHVNGPPSRQIIESNSSTLGNGTCR